MFRKKILAISLTIAISFVFLLSVLPATAQAEDKKHAIFSMAAWVGDHLPIYVPKILLEDHLGYTTEIVDLSDSAAAVALSMGEIDLLFIIWFPNNEPALRPFLKNGTVEYLGEMYGKLPQGMFVPKWMAKQYNLKSIPDLANPEIAKLVDLDNDGKGDWLGCDPGWGCARLNEECIKAYGLEKLYEQKVGGHVLLKAAAIGQLKKDKPVLLFNFWPNDFFVDYPWGTAVEYLEDPLKFWEVCNVPKHGNKKWLEKNPKAAKLLRQVTMTGKDVQWQIGEALKRGDDPATLEAIAREWIAKNQATVDSWLTVIK